LKSRIKRRRAVVDMSKKLKSAEVVLEELVDVFEMAAIAALKIDEAFVKAQDQGSCISYWIIGMIKPLRCARY
jgi:hypothetical protein